MPFADLPDASEQTLAKKADDILAEDVLPQLSYDGTPGSLQQIQDAVMPAAKAGNIIALNICRQTMHGLGQDMALKKITMKMARQLDEKLVHSWFSGVRQKADAGDSFFKVVMGILSFFGTGTEKDDQKTLALLKEAAEHGYHDAFLKMGNFYKAGIIFRKDLNKAAEYYRKGGEKGSAVALYNIGCMHNDAEGMPENISMAMEYWKKSADMGHAWSQYNLGLFYVNGRAGYNPTEGKRWLEKAAKQGHEKALKLMSNFAR